MMNNKLTLKWLLPLVVSVFLCHNVFATPPQSISYQAYLKDSAGLPVNGTPAITFRIYDALTGGSLLWSAVMAVPVTDGLFSVELGTPAIPLPVAAMNNSLWLGIEIGVDGEAVPRKLFSATNNAFRAEDSDTLGGKSEAELQDRVSGTCAAGQSIRAIAADGTVSCEADDNTTYNGSNFATSNQFCSTGQSVTGVDSGGRVTCAVDANSGGDITSVTAGTGIDGGGTAGSVTLSHSNTSSQSSANNSNGYVIQDVTLDTYGHLTSMLSTNLDSRYYTETEANSKYVNVTGDSMSGSLSTSGSVLITGTSAVLKVSPAGGSAILANTMRTSNTIVPASDDITNSGDFFLSNDLEVGGQIYASKSLFMNGNNAAGDDGDQMIYFYNGGNQRGQSIKWNDFEGRFDLSTHTRIYGFVWADQNVIAKSDVDVTGTVYMGYERVQGSYVPVTTNVGNCTVLGTTNCYYSTAYASCPTGKVVIGGGCNSNLSANTVIGDSYPLTTSWYCNAHSSSNNGSLQAIALCARMGD